LAHQFPEVLADLRQVASAERVPPFAARYAHRNPGRDPGSQLDRIEERVWQALALTPRRLDVVARTVQGVEALRRLVDRGIATLAAFTSSDALHVLGRQGSWTLEAAQLGAAILATEERNARAAKTKDTAEGLSERVYQHVLRAAGRV